MVIETESLILRPFREEDYRDVYEYLHTPAAHCFACMKLETLEAARAEMLNRLGETEYYFAITLKENGKVIGEIDAYPETEAPRADEDESGDTFSPCWMLNAGYQGKGYAYEAASAFFDYLFREKGARRIYAYTEDDNIPSQHLCEKLGMRREGLFQEFVSFICQPDGSRLYENTIQYAVLKHEWQANKRPGESQRLHTAAYGQPVRIQPHNPGGMRDRLSALESALAAFASGVPQLQKSADSYDSSLWWKDDRDDMEHLWADVISLRNRVKDLLAENVQ